MKKMLLAVLLASTLTFGTFALAACNGNEEDPPETTHTQHVDANDDGVCDECGEPMQGETTEPEELTLTDGIYISDIIGGNRGYNYVRFHENGVFYYAFMANAETPGGGQAQAGYYEVVEEELTFEDKTDESQTVERTADSYIVLTNFDGTPCNLRAVNSGETMTNQIPLYDDALWGIWYDDMKYSHDGDPDFTIDQEMAIAVAEFVDPENSFNTVSIGHNGMFDDNIAYDEGEWTYDDATRAYTLTGSYGTATLVVSEDGATALYTCGDTQLTLNNVNAEVSDEVTAVVEQTDTTGMMTLSFYNDGAYSVTAAGQEVSSGTWSLEIPYLTVGSFNTMMTGGDVTVELAITTTQGEMTFSFILSTDQLTTLSQTEIVEPELEALVQQADSTGMMTLNLYEDGTYEVIARLGEQVQTMQTGNWSLSIPYLTIGAFETMMTGGDVVVTLTLTTGNGDMQFSFTLTTDQLLALNG